MVLETFPKTKLPKRKTLKNLRNCENSEKKQKHENLRKTTENREKLQKKHRKPSESAKNNTVNENPTFQNFSINFYNIFIQHIKRLLFKEIDKETILLGKVVFNTARSYECKTHKIFLSLNKENKGTKICQI